MSSSLPSANFLPGVRYNFSLYCCSSEPPQLLQRLQGYMQELGKDWIPLAKTFVEANQKSLSSFSLPLFVFV